MRKNTLSEAKQCRDYLKRHIYNVNKGFDYLVDNHIISDTQALSIDLHAHDASKSEELEFNSYAQYFYGDLKDNDFNYAWLHHIHNNPHHWQYWVLINDDEKYGTPGKTIALEMPERYVIEMICDWWAFSWMKGNLFEIFDWYKTHKDCMLLHENTRKLIEKYLDKIKKSLQASQK